MSEKPINDNDDGKMVDEPNDVVYSQYPSTESIDTMVGDLRFEWGLDNEDEDVHSSGSDSSTATTKDETEILADRMKTSVGFYESDDEDESTQAQDGDSHEEDVDDEDQDKSNDDWSATDPKGAKELYQIIQSNKRPRRRPKPVIKGHTTGMPRNPIYKRFSRSSQRRAALHECKTRNARRQRKERKARLTRRSSPTRRVLENPPVLDIPPPRQTRQMRQGQRVRKRFEF